MSRAVHDGGGSDGHGRGQTHLIIYDQGLRSISEISGLEQMPNLETLNLHSNLVSRIDGLSALTKLRELNISSNELLSMDGLECLASLENLNLASNQITDITGVGALRRLKMLNLSFNKISSLAGLRRMHGDYYALKFIDLRGNQVRELYELAILSGLVHLEEVLFRASSGKQANPVCESPEYARRALQSLPQATAAVDGHRVVRDVNGVGSIPTIQNAMPRIDHVSFLEPRAPVGGAPVGGGIGAAGTGVGHADRVLAAHRRLARKEGPRVSGQVMRMVNTLDHEIRLEKLETDFVHMSAELSQSQTRSQPVGKAKHEVCDDGKRTATGPVEKDTPNKEQATSTLFRECVSLEGSDSATSPQHSQPTHRHHPSQSKKK
eukprot:Rmarinus@m.14322